MSDSPRLFCFGLGYSAARLADGLLDEGWEVVGTRRDPARGAPAPLTGRVRVLGFGADTPSAALEPELLRASHLLVSVPPGPSGDPVLGAHEALLRARAAELAWVGYLSTTGVYGDHGGGLVDEGTEPRPTQARSIRRMEAERAWLALWRESGLPVHVFRLAGIYGPGRSAFDQIRAGRARRVVKPGHVFGRVHVDDIAGALRASIAQPAPGAIYNLADDEPAAPAEVIAHACALMGVAPPDEVPFDVAKAEMSEMALSFWADNRRVDNTRLARELGYRLRHPTYREGLQAILEAERADPAPR